MAVFCVILMSCRPRRAVSSRPSCLHEIPEGDKWTRLGFFLPARYWAWLTAGVAGTFIIFYQRGWIPSQLAPAANSLSGRSCSAIWVKMLCSTDPISLDTGPTSTRRADSVWKRYCASPGCVPVRSRFQRETSYPRAGEQRRSR